MNVFATMYNGATGQALKRITLDRHERYAAKCNARFVCAEGFPGQPFASLMMHKMKSVKDLLNSGDRVLWIDGDVLIRHDSPNLFDIVPCGSFGAVDEGALCDTHQLYERCQHIVRTCQEESLPVPETGGRYFNCGMFMASPKHELLFWPRISQSDHTWCEQSLINSRLFLNEHKPWITSLPECFNRFVYWGPKPARYADSSYFLHYAGPPSQEKRLVDMRRQSEQWGINDA